MRADALHGMVNLEKFLAGTIERAQPGAARIHEGLVNVE